MYSWVGENFGDCSSSPLPIPDISERTLQRWSEIMFTNARNPVINGGNFTVQGDIHSERRGEHTISAVKQMLIVVHSNEGPTEIYRGRRISQF